MHDINDIRKKVDLKSKNLAFMIFSEYMRQKTVTIPQNEFKKICSVMWKGFDNIILNKKMKKHVQDNNIKKISDNDKNVYMKLAKEAKELKMKRMRDYEHKLKDTILEKLKMSQLRKITQYVFNGKDIKCDNLKSIVEKYNIKKHD